jgi:hypothetical protein
MTSPFQKLKPETELNRIKEELGLELIVAYTGYASYMDKNQDNPQFKDMYQTIENVIKESIETLANSRLGADKRIGIVYGGDAAGVPRITHNESKKNKLNQIVVLPFCGRDCITDYESPEAIFFIPPPPTQTKSMWGDECTSLVGIADYIIILGGNDLTYFEWGAAVKNASNNKLKGVIPIRGTGGAAQKIHDSSIDLKCIVHDIGSGKQAAEYILLFAEHQC